MWHPSSPIVTTTSYQVEHSQSCQAHSSIELGPTQMLQDIDDDLVRGVPVGEPGDTHQRRNLANGNVDRRPSHVGRDGG